jgi:ribosomal-protein-alanine N-acetyltransferase
VNLDFPSIKTERLILRLANRRDVTAILRYYAENREFLTPVEPAKSDNFYTTEFWKDQVEKALIEFNYDQSLKFCLFKKSNTERLIGRINFTHIQRGMSYSCLLGYSLAEHEQGHGYMTEALTAANQYIFHQLNLHRILANYMPRNQRSGKLLRRLGFVVEGYARDYLLINQKWEDHILTSLINPDWKL